ncbi:MAG: DNA/RNA nuclease SfsA [Ruminococcaceae bacterium]|nr:DNA/RNA nuclease SfsA [Oscillospiraceae bacterium]
MKYNKIIKGIFINRPNRFIANVQIDDKMEAVHVKNTGRCKELLIEGCTVYLSISENPARKTKYDLVAVEKIKDKNTIMLINIDSQVVNDVAEEWLKKGNIFSKDALIKREVTFGKSRFDFYIEDKNRKAFLEVKGVTLENEGVASFPDAPTERGIKHINELCICKSQGYDAYILFVIQMKGVSIFKPNEVIHKRFADALRNAEKGGVKIICIDCIVSENEIIADSYLPFAL